MPKVLVTGATGFIGNHVVQELLQYDCTIVTSSSSAENAATANWFNQVRHIPLNLRQLDETEDYFQWFGRPDKLIHLAWEGLPNYQSSFHEEVNLPGHFSLLTNLVRHGLTDVTITGTCFEYGMQEGCLREDMPALPANAYARAKDLLRKKLEDFKMSHPFLLKWVRLFYMYGKGQHPNSLLSQLDRALANGEPAFNMSGGEQVRDYLPVEIVARNIVKIALQEKADGIINNCSGNPITVRQLVENHLKTVNKHIRLNTGFYPYPDYEPMRFWGDTTKLKKVISNE